MICQKRQSVVNRLLYSLFRCTTALKTKVMNQCLLQMLTDHSKLGKSKGSNDIKQFSIKNVPHDLISRPLIK